MAELKIETLQSYTGQLRSMRDKLVDSGYLTDDEIQDLCDGQATLECYISTVAKRLKYVKNDGEEYWKTQDTEKP